MILKILYAIYIRKGYIYMSNITLVVMAAGIGSRFGGGIKQLEPVGINGEVIVDFRFMMLLRQDLIKLFL